VALEIVWSRLGMDEKDLRDGDKSKELSLPARKYQRSLRPIDSSSLGSLHLKVRVHCKR